MSKSTLDSSAITLNQLDAHTFQHLVNCLSVAVLGPGVLSFAKGADGGRDGYFEGECPYPSHSEKWKGTWYIQSKYCDNPAGAAGQRWLVEQVKSELKKFSDPGLGRVWPDNWIVATNVDVSAVAGRGTFDKIKKLVATYNPRLAKRCAIWGRSTLATYLANNPQVLATFRHLVTPGFVLSKLLEAANSDEKRKRNVLRHLVAVQIVEQQYTKLDQAGSSADSRPGVHDLFIDLPYVSNVGYSSLVLETLSLASAGIHKPQHCVSLATCWKDWQKRPDRARIFFLRGGPGQGKSTVGQFFSQVHRSAILLTTDRYFNSATGKKIALAIRDRAEKMGCWPLLPRYSAVLELKEFAQWVAERRQKQASESTGILSFWAAQLSARCQTSVSADLLRELLSEHRWFFSFDGLDEVPSDMKDIVASEVRSFLSVTWEECDADLIAICTSRPQGYSGEFDSIEGPALDLVHLSKDKAISCANPLLKSGRTDEEYKESVQILKAAMETQSVAQLMRTPLQCHIMAIVIREGGRPPERRWALFTNFYNVIRRREARNKTADKELLSVLQNQTILLKNIHNSLGFVLHKRAETSAGSVTSISRSDFQKMAEHLVKATTDLNSRELIATLMRATVDRLVLVNTPDNGDKLRFDVRQLQEFFAAEFCYENLTTEEFRKRFAVIAGDSHWFEVTHFALSAVIENQRKAEQLIAAKVVANLNSGDERESRLSWCLARGAVHTVMLLQEGVLEQDKAIREEFGETISPVIETQCAQIIELARAVKTPNSRDWLCRYLIKGFRAARDDRRIGAAVVLSWLVDDHSPFVGEALDLFRELNGEALAYVLFQRFEAHPGPETLVPVKWVLVPLLEQLRSDNWFADRWLRESGIMVLRYLPEHIWGVSLSADEIAVWREVFAKTHGEGGGTMVRFGDVCAVSRATGCGMKGKSKVTESIRCKVTGVFAFFADVVVATRKDDMDRLRNALKPLLGLGGLDGLFSLPTLCAAVPRRKGHELSVDLTELMSSTSKRRADYIHELGPQVQRRYWFVQFYDPGENVPAKVFLEKHRDLAVLRLRSLLGPTSEGKGEPLGVEQMAELALDEDAPFCSIANSWGIFLSIPDSEIVERVRQKIRAVPDFSTRRNVFYWREREFVSFKVSLPEEKRALPYLVSCVFLGCVSQERRGKETELVDSLARIASECFPDPRRLSDLAASGGESSYVRVSALMFLDCLNKGKYIESWKAWTSVIVEAISTDVSGEFTRVFALWIRILHSPAEADVREIVSSVLEAVVGNYARVDAMETLLSHWREVSAAPVTKHGVGHEIWGEVVGTGAGG